MGKIRRTLVTLGIWIGVQILVTLIMIIAATANGAEISGVINTIMAPSLLISDALVIILLIAIRYCKAKELFQLVPKDIFIISLIFGICGMFAVDMIAEPLDIPNVLADQFKDLSKSIMGFLAICIIGPVMEEMMMRRVILTEMSKLTNSMWGGIIISALMFAVIHLNPIQVVFALPAGIILGWLYCKTGSLFVPICLHILNNTISFITIRMDTGADSESPLSITKPLGLALFCVILIITIGSLIWINRYYSKKAKEEQAALEAQSEGDSSASELVQ
jgi:hypothetical protein